MLQIKVTNTNKLTEYFKPILEEDYDIDLFSYLLEILNKNEPIKLDSDYLNDYYERDDIKEDDVWQYKDDKAIKELKADMYEWVEEIQKAVLNIPGVESAKISDSTQAGMSTYLNVSFEKPNENDPIAKEKLKDDKKFITHYLSGFGNNGGGYGGEYRLKFRISNHDAKHISNTNVFMNILGHNFNWIKDTIVDLCKKRVLQLQSYWKDYCRTGEISPKQIKRNQKRKDGEFLRLEYLKKGFINEKYTHLLKETFGGDRIKSMLNNITLKYLENVGVDIEDIVYNVESHFQKAKIDYIALLYILVNCLNQFIIEYTFDEGFDYDLLYSDMQQEIDKIKLD